MDTFKTKHIGDWFGVSHQTVKNWCKEFRTYLSPTAVPESGQPRQFTENDVKVLALVADMKSNRHTFTDIHATLQTGQRGEIPPFPHRLPAIAPQQMLDLQSHIGELETQLRAAEDKSKEFEGQVNLLKDLLEKKESQLQSLYKQVAKLESAQDAE